MLQSAQGRGEEESITLRGPKDSVGVVWWSGWLSGRLVGSIVGEGVECYSSACITQQQWGTARQVTASGLMGEPGHRFTSGQLSVTHALLFYYKKASRSQDGLLESARTCQYKT